MSAIEIIARMQIRIRRIRRRLAAAAAVLATIASVSVFVTMVASPEAVAAQSPPAAFFLDGTGTLNGYGINAAGAWSQAAPIGPAGIAPPGAPVSTAVMPSGSDATSFVASDRSLVVLCWPKPVVARFTALSFTPDSPVAISMINGIVIIGVMDLGNKQWTVLQDSYDPCTNPTQPLTTMAKFPAPWYAGAPISMTTLANGAVGLFVGDGSGAVHGLWFDDQSGAISDNILTQPGATGAGSTIAVAPRTGATKTVDLFYPASDGNVYVGQSGENSSSVQWDPDPDPWRPAFETTADAALAATTAIPGETDVSYVAADGSVVDLSVDGNGSWLSASKITASGFASPGEPVASSSTDADGGAFDEYCGTRDGHPWHLPIGPNGPDGPGGPAGPAGLLGATTELGAA